MTLRRLATFALLPCLLLFSSCAGIKPQPLLSKVLILSAEDFGPDAMAAPLLGPASHGQPVVVHHALPDTYLAAKYPGHRTTRVVPAIKHLNRSLNSLPNDSAHTVWRSRMKTTRDRLLDFYNTRRVAFNSVPPFVGRGFMTRQAMMPAMGTSR